MANLAKKVRGICFRNHVEAGSDLLNLHSCKLRLSGNYLTPCNVNAQRLWYLNSYKVFQSNTRYDTLVTRLLGPKISGGNKASCYMALLQALFFPLIFGPYKRITIVPTKCFFLVSLPKCVLSANARQVSGLMRSNNFSYFLL